MITGFNTDVKHKAKVYHVQTEDKGRKNPKIETLVYMGGEILDSFRTTYDNDRETMAEEEIVVLMETQHKKVIKSIKIGKYDTDDDDAVDFLTERDFDQVITDYLAAETSDQSLILEVDNTPPISRGRTNEIRLRTRTTENEAIQGASIRVKLVSSAHRPKVLCQGETDREGTYKATFDIPALQGDDFAVLVQASSDFGTAEFRHLV
ncbi:MAG: hypothetical protein KDC35_08225 [Acidobacteria bacterium]|nr:hypothetical protein [Acidobacteriota bacterium]